MDTLWNVAKFAVPALAVVLVAVPFLGGCTPRRCGPWGRGGEDPQKLEERFNRHLDRVLADLEVTDEQRTQIYAVRDRLIPELRALHAGRGAARTEFVAAWNQEAFDAEALHRDLDQRSAEVTAFLHRLVDAAAEVHAVLTPEQRAELAEKMSKRRWH